MKYKRKKNTPKDGTVTFTAPIGFMSGVQNYFGFFRLFFVSSLFFCFSCALAKIDPGWAIGKKYPCDRGEIEHHTHAMQLSRYCFPFASETQRCQICGTSYKNN